MTTDELRLKWEHNLDKIECNMPFVSKMPEWDIAIALQNQIEEFLEDLKLLATPAVVGRSELLVCEYCNEDAKPTCCDKCLERMVNAVQKAN